MYTILTDRIFWIYFIIALFFIIIGIGLIISSTNINIIAISITYLVTILILLLIVYYAYLLNSSNCNNYILIFVNVIFIMLLVISTLWAGEINNLESGPLGSLCGVLIILGGVILFSLSSNNYDIYTFSYWISILYIVIWISLTLYVTI